MTTTALLIAAEHRRQQIPLAWQMAFEEITDAELASMSRDEGLALTLRAFAGWELEYREAAGFEVFYDGSITEEIEVACRLSDRKVLTTATKVQDEIRRRKA